jgi:hypothetical protein
MEESSLGAELDDSFTEFASINARGYILGAIRRGETEQDARKHVSGILAKYADVSRDFQIQEVDQRLAEYRLYGSSKVGTEEYSQLRTELDDQISKASPFSQSSEQLARDRRHFITKRGIIALGPVHAKATDEIWVINGGHVPFLLRPTGEGTYTFVGECYVQGFMKGEMLKDEYGLKAQMETVDIM